MMIEFHFHEQVEQDFVQMVLLIIFHYLELLLILLGYLVYFSCPMALPPDIDKTPKYGLMTET